MHALVIRLVSAVLLFLSSSASLFAEAPPPSLELLILGSGGPGATGRAGSGYLVLVDGLARILIDAGPGTFARLGEAKVSLSKTDIVLFTHLHIDHVGEIPGLVKARAVSGSGPITFNIWGPAGSSGHGEDAYFPSTTEFIRLLFGPKGAFAYLKNFAAPISLLVHDIPAPVRRPASTQIFRDSDLSISAVAGHHGDAPAVIYRVDHAGKSITFSGDIDAKGLAALRGIARDSELLIFNSVVLDPPGSPEVLYTLHTPPLAIGQLASGSGVHALLLSHLSPAVEEQSDAVLKSIRRSYAGPVTFAKDGMRVQP